MPRQELPMYSIAEAARYVRVAPATLRSWVKGRTYNTTAGSAFFRPLIQLPDSEQSFLSFENLIEAHVLWGLRNRHDVSLKHVRVALEYAQDNLGVDRLLLHENLRTSAGDLFFDKYHQLINLSKSGQIAMRKILESYLNRIEWNDDLLPVRLYPFSGDPTVDEERIIVIDPRLHFGRPIIQSAGVSTAVLANRIDNGEPIDELADDYGITVDEIESAIVFETAA